MSARILAFDVSTCTGYAFWESKKDPSSIITGLMELPEPRSYYDESGKKKHDYKWDDWRVAQVGPKVNNILRELKPDFVLIEERMRFPKAGDSAFGMTNAIHGAIYSHLCSWGKMFGVISSQSWRKPAYGTGFKQPLIPDMGRDGRQKIDPKTNRPAFKLKDWGDIAVERCEFLSIDLPPKKATAHNAAEAALMAMVWRHQSIITIAAERDHKRYIQLLQGKPLDESGEKAA